MSVDTAPAMLSGPSATTLDRPSPTRLRVPFVIAGRTARRTVRSGIGWGYVFGLVTASSALTYSTAYKTAGQRAHVATLFGQSAGLAAITGPARRLETVAGYTAWKSFLFLVVLGGVWGLLTATRQLRGEEEAGRWELLLAGRTTRRSACAQALAGVGAGLVTLWAVTAVIVVVVGRASSVHISAPAALFFSVAVVVPAACFAALGALTSQLLATRRQAAGYAGAALAAAYLLRMVADSEPSLGWLRLTSPLGWAEELHPLTGSEPLLLLPLAASTVVFVGLAVHLAGRRDIGSSTFPERTRPRPRTALLFGAVGLSVRLQRGQLLAWAAGIGAWSLVVGFVAKQGGSVLTLSSSVEHVVRRLGASGATTAAYLGIVMLMLAWLVALAASTQVTATAEEEQGGRLEPLAVRPVSRLEWYWGRFALSAGAVVGLCLIGAVACWLGVASQHAGVGLGALLVAGMNMAPAGLCVVGAGFLALGLHPRAPVFAVYGLLVWSIVLELVGGFFTTSHWLLDTSLFHHMAAAPGVPPRVTSALVMAAVGLAAAAAGSVAFARRDLAGS